MQLLILFRWFAAFFSQIIPKNTSIMERITKKILLIFVLLFAVVDAFADMEPKVIGRWVTEPMLEENEKVIIEYVFEKPESLTMNFYTENYIKGTGYCLSRTAVYFSCNFLGPLCLCELKDKPYNVEIVKFWLEANGSEAIERINAKNMIEAQMKQMLSAYEDGVSMIYITIDDPDKIAFVIGDEADAMELNFTRFSGDIVAKYFSEIKQPAKKSSSSSYSGYSSPRSSSAYSSYSSSSSSSWIQSRWVRYLIIFVIVSLISYFRNRNKDNGTTNHYHSTNDKSNADANTITPPEYKPSDQTPPEYKPSDQTPPEPNNAAAPESNTSDNSTNRESDTIAK